MKSYLQGWANQPKITQTVHVNIYIDSCIIYPKYSVGALKEKSTQLSTWVNTKTCPFKDFIYRLMKTH